MPALPSKRRVLVVDDDRSAREAIRGSLASAGYDCEGVSVAAGLTPELIEVLAPGLVLVDEAVGGLDRETAMRVVIEARHRVNARLLLMGAGDMMALGIRAREIGADGHIAKSRLIADAGRALALEASLVVPPTSGLLPPPLPPPLPRPAPPPDILSMIDEELVRAEAQAPPRATDHSFDVEVDLFSEHNFYLAKTSNGQQVGIFVATSFPPPVGSPVKVRVRLASGARFQTPGEVIWVRTRAIMNGKLPAGAGIRMLELTDATKTAVKSFLSERAPYSYSGQ